jgi:hypothetical protein
VVVAPSRSVHGSDMLAGPIRQGGDPSPLLADELQ